MLNRRNFLATSALAPWLANDLLADAPNDVKITHVIGFDVRSMRTKIAGKNSRLDVHGNSATDRMAKITTNTGAIGIGSCRMSKESAAQLIGRNPFDFYDREQRRIRGPIGPGTMPLWDLIAKIQGKPGYQLFGKQGPQQVPVYDGSLYFADLLPQYADHWQDRFREEIDMGLKLGHRAFKVKIGRGAKWMPRRDGDRRDIDVLRSIRAHGGNDVLLGIDANNGYDLGGAKRLFDEIGPLDIAFAEELFPETVEDCLAFKEYLTSRGLKTLVADGETQSKLEVFKPFIAARAIDVYQADMRRFGFEGILREASWAAEQDLRIAPHNWGSLIGYYMQLHVGRAIPNFYRAEHDPLSTSVIVADGYKIADGTATVPEVPGFGLLINEKQFARHANIRFSVS